MVQKATSMQRQCSGKRQKGRSVYVMLLWVFLGASVYSRKTRYLHHGSGVGIPVGARFFLPVQTGPPGPPSRLYKGYRVSFPGVKWPGRGPRPLAPRVKKGWSYTSTPPLGLHGLLQGELYLYLHYVHLSTLSEWFTLNGFPWNLIMGTFTKISQDNPNLIKIGHFTWRPKYILLLPVTLKSPWRHSRVKWYQAYVNAPQCCTIHCLPYLNCDNADKPVREFAKSGSAAVSYENCLTHVWPDESYIQTNF